MSHCLSHMQCIDTHMIMVGDSQAASFQSVPPVTQFVDREGKGHDLSLVRDKHSDSWKWLVAK